MIIIKSRGLKERFLTKLKIYQFHRNQSDVRFILAVMKDVPTKQRKEEYVEGTEEPRGILAIAVMKDVPIRQRKEEFV